ncbi:MAG: hypothetical protein ACI9RU_002516 [Litorivivens sp.]
MTESESYFLYLSNRINCLNMKHLLFFVATLFLAPTLSSQESFWQEDFGSGCNIGQLAPSFSGANGLWTTTWTGANQLDANKFYISAAENGNDAGACGSGCGNDQSLHVGNIFIDVILIQIPAYQGASYYDSGASGLCGFINCSQTDIRVESPVIDCSGHTDVLLDFGCLEGGSGAIVNPTLWCFDGSSWSELDDPAKKKTLCCGGAYTGTNQGMWTEYSIALPASANENANIKLGFRWVNNDDGVGTDPSFAVDDITVVGGPVQVTVCFGYFNDDGLINTADLLMFLSDLAVSRIVLPI